MSEEIWGPHATSHLGAVAGANATWVIVPIYLIVRMWKSSEPFAGTAQSFVRGDK